MVVQYNSNAVSPPNIVRKETHAGSTIGHGSTWLHSVTHHHLHCDHVRLPTNTYTTYVSKSIKIIQISRDTLTVGQPWLAAAHMMVQDGRQTAGNYRIKKFSNYKNKILNHKFVNL